MAEFISKNRIFDLIHAVNSVHGFTSYEDYAGLLKDVETSTNADVQLVRHGRWLHDRRTQWKCSECGNFLDFDGLNCGRGSAFYCPNCGARMDGDTNG